MPGGLLDTEKKAIADAIADHESGKYDYDTMVLISLNVKDACGTCGKAMGNYVFAYQDTVYYHPGGLVLPDSVWGLNWEVIENAGFLQAQSGGRMGFGYVRPKSPCD